MRPPVESSREKATCAPNAQAEQPAERACSSLLLDETAEAERLGLTPEELARAAVADLLASVGEDFEVAAGRVLKKNEELYRRLA